MSGSKSPSIGISTRSVVLPGRRETVRGVFSAYIDSLQASGAEAVLLPPGSVETLARLDGLMLVGGEDLASTTWWSAGAPNPPMDPERDKAEALLVERAYSLSLPTLGICRGAQLVNCVLGGKVGNLDPASVVKHCGSTPSDSVAHPIRVAPNTRLASATDHRVEFRVVSRHATRIADLGAGLLASAWARDGSIEAVEATDWPFLGVLWHAEWSAENVEPDLSVFRWLSAEAKQRMQR